MLSWLSTNTKPDLDPFIFVTIGLGIISFLFHSYLDILQRIYNQGGYLAIFHEGNQKDLRWHLLSRLRGPLLGVQSSWGWDGKRGGCVLIMLIIANIGGPLWLLRQNINTSGAFVLFAIPLAIYSSLLAHRRNFQLIAKTQASCQSDETPKVIGALCSQWRSPIAGNLTEIPSPAQ